MPAGGACVGAVASMGAHVFRQGAGLREGLAAGGAGVWAVAGMGAHVACQAAGLREGLAAGGAGVGAIAGMAAHVFTEIISTRRARLPPVLHNTKPAPPQGLDGGAINTPESSEGMCFLRYEKQHDCGCASASSAPTGGALLL